MDNKHTPIEDVVEELIRTIEIVTFPYDEWTDKDKETVGNVLRKTLQSQADKYETLIKKAYEEVSPAKLKRMGYPELAEALEKALEAEQKSTV